MGIARTARSATVARPHSRCTRALAAATTGFRRAARRADRRRDHLCDLKRPLITARPPLPSGTLRVRRQGNRRMHAPVSQYLPLLLFVPLMAWRMYGRIRRSIGRQALSKWRPRFTIVAFPLLIA